MEKKMLVTDEEESNWMEAERGRKEEKNNNK